MIRVVALDLDGTLVDTPSAIVDTFTAVFAAMDLRGIDALAIRATIGLPLDQSFSTLMRLPVDDERVAFAARQYVPLFRDVVLPRARDLVFPGVADGLAALHDRGYKLAVATSKYRANAEALLSAAGLRDRMSLVIGADQVRRPKPHPEMLRGVMRTLGVPAARMVMVGDTTHDLLMARAAGVPSIAVTYGVHDWRKLASAEPTWIADSFADVVRHVTEDREDREDRFTEWLDPTLPV